MPTITDIPVAFVEFEEIVRPPLDIHLLHHLSVFKEIICSNPYVRE
jgi:hypothetical protein